MLKPVTVLPMWLTLFDLVSWLCEVRIKTMLTNFQSLKVYLSAYITGYSQDLG